MELPPGRVTFHVLESNDPPPPLLDHIRANAVDQAIAGGRAD